MSINIKSEEACRLVGELAHLTGETERAAITAALKERLERERRVRNAETRFLGLRDIGKRSALLLEETPVVAQESSSLVVCRRPAGVLAVKGAGRLWCQTSQELF